MPPFIATFFSGINLRTKVLTALGILFCIAVVMALRAHDKGVADKAAKEAVAPYVEASTEAVLEAVGAERKANMESAKRNTIEDGKTATIQESIDYAKDNDQPIIDAYFRGLCIAQGNCPKDQPAD